MVGRFVYNLEYGMVLLAFLSRLPSPRRHFWSSVYPIQRRMFSGRRRFRSIDGRRAYAADCPTQPLSIQFSYRIRAEQTDRPTSNHVWMRKAC